MDIAKLLSCTEHVAVEELASNFIEHYSENPEKAIGNFVEFLFHAGGWMSFEYSKSKFPPNNELEFIKEFASIDLYPLIFDKDGEFQHVFSSFIALVVHSDKCMLLYKENFMSKVVLAFNTLVKSQWDSFRLVALILGMRLLLSLDKEYESLKSTCSIDDSQKDVDTNYKPNICKKRAYLSPPWQQIFLKIYCGAKLCVHHSLCRCYRFMQNAENDVKSLCPFHEVLIWAVTLPTTTIQEDRWLPAILHGLRDKSIDNQGIAVMALYQLFRHPTEISNQIKMFNHVKSDIFYLLKARSEVAEMCLRIINSCVRYMDIELNDSDMDIILYYLYDESQSMAVLAAEFVYWSVFASLVNDPVAIIVQLVEINQESFIKSEDLLIDSLYHMIKTSLKWGDWVTVVEDAPIDNVPDFMRMLSAYVRKATTGFTPRFRKWNVSQQTMDSSELETNSSHYSNIFSDIWFTLLELKRVNDNSKAVACLLKMIQYLDSSILASSEVVCNLAQVCLAYLVVTEDFDVMEEACHSLAALKALTTSTENDVPGLQDVINVAIQQGVCDFQKCKWDKPSSKTVQKKIVLLTKYFDVNDSSLWGLSFDLLRNAPSIKMDRNLKMKKITTLICLLFQLLMNTVNAASRGILIDRNYSTSNVLISCCTSRTAAVKALLKHFLDSQYDRVVRKTAFIALMSILEFMGPHLTTQKRLWPYHISLDEEEVSAMVNYGTEVMESTKNCCHSLSQNAKLNDCCTVAYKTCEFISRGLLDIHCITPFLRCIGRCSSHDEIFIKAINEYSSNFPNRWEILAASILNAYVSMLENALPLCHGMDDTPHGFKCSPLYVSMINLTQYLAGRSKFSNKNIMKIISIRLHIHLIDIALRPDGPRLVLELLYAVREILATEDVDLVYNSPTNLVPTSVTLPSYL